MPKKITHKTGFLNVLCGGTGLLGAGPFHELWEADHRRLPVYSVVLDTDMPEERLIDEGIIDACIPVGLTHHEIRAVKGSHATFGRTVEAIVREMWDYLDEEDFRNGARTTRCLAQLAFEVHRDLIASRLNQCIRDFQHREGTDEIVPVFTGSSGGGTGSSFVILLAQALQDTAFRSRVFQGLTDGQMNTPTAFMVEPFFRSFVHSEDAIHPARILGNAMAFRIESEYLERKGRFKNIYHQGLSNAGGAVLDSERDVAKVLGTSVYQFEKHWSSYIKPRTVDTADVLAIFGHYLGHDTPERAMMNTRPTPVQTEPSPNGQPQPS
ncbi:MAG: hypothetical protein HYX68_27270 [Planctomycetes bacterium]|nr:hypothetical protein [Planctomycetota bacterium]